MATFRLRVGAENKIAMPLDKHNGQTLETLSCLSFFPTRILALNSGFVSSSYANPCARSRLLPSSVKD